MSGTWSLRTRVVALTLIALLPILAVVTYIVSQSLQNNRQQLIDTEIFVSETVAQGLATTFDDNSSVLESLAASNDVRMVVGQAMGSINGDPTSTGSSDVAVQETFQDILDYRRNINGLFLVDATGQLVTDGGIYDPTTFGPLVADTVARTNATGTLAISGSLTLPGEDASFVALTVPIFAPGETSGVVIGAAGAILSVDRLRQTFTPFARGSTIIMVVADRQIVTSSAPDAERSPMLNAFLKAGETTEQVFDYDGGNGVQRVAVTSAVDLGNGSPWTVVVSTYTPGAYGSTQALLQRGVIVMLIAILLTAAIAWLMAGRTTRALERLASRALAVASGDLAAREQLVQDTQGGREARRIGVAVRELAARLSEQKGELASSHRLREEQASQLRDLNRRNVRSQEEERRRIAGDIHDAVSPLITGALYQSRAMVLSSETPDPEAQRQGLRDISELLTSANDELHRVIFDLRPPDLDDLGVVAAIERYIANFSVGGMGTPTITVTGQEPPGLTPEIRVTVYRIVQEALHNIVRHSGADEAVVALDTFDGQFQVMIRDNGAGFDPEQASRPTSLGLLSMRERAAAIGATLHIESTPGLGTSVILDRRMSAPSVPGRRSGRRGRSPEVVRRPASLDARRAAAEATATSGIGPLRDRLLRRLNQVAGL